MTMRAAYLCHSTYSEMMASKAPESVVKNNLYAVDIIKMTRAHIVLHVFKQFK